MNAGWNAAGILTAVSAATTTKHIPAFGNPFRVSAGLRSEVLSLGRDSAKQARSGTQAGLGSKNPLLHLDRNNFPLSVVRLPVIHRNLLVRPLAGEFIRADQNHQSGVSGVQLPGLVAGCNGQDSLRRH
jgi:hypothetical protein